jgi:hypothetical protein
MQEYHGVAFNGADTHEIVAVELTPDDVGDISVMPEPP